MWLALPATFFLIPPNRMERCRRRGLLSLIVTRNPHVPVFPKMREHYFDLKSFEITPENIKGYDCVLVGTHHDAFDFAMIREHATLIVDTRGAI